MPTYEYLCKDCGHEFEQFLVKGRRLRVAALFRVQVRLYADQAWIVAEQLGRLAQERGAAELARRGEIGLAGVPPRELVRDAIRRAL